MPAPAPTSPPAAAPLDQFVSMWPAVLEAVSSVSRVAWTLFTSSTQISVHDATLAVAVDSAGKVKNIKDGGHDERLRHAIVDVMKTDVRIDVVLDPS